MGLIAFEKVAEKPHRLPLKFSAVDPQVTIRYYHWRRCVSSPTGITLIRARGKESSEAQTSAPDSCQRLLAEVTLHHVGLVLGLEMRRLARRAQDRHHLLAVCALFSTLLADQDGVYDAHAPNDRLL